jgi:hypothetical protein
VSDRTRGADAGDRDVGATEERPGDVIDPVTTRMGIEHVRAVRLGHGANCSSVGSVIDTLFLGAAVGGAIFAAVCAAMTDEPVRIVGRRSDAGSAPRSGSARGEGLADSGSDDEEHNDEERSA